MQVVINNCYGVFGLSEGAIIELIKKKSKYITRMTIEAYHNGNALPQLKPHIAGYKKDPNMTGMVYKGKYIYFVEDNYAPEFRCDKELVEVVERLKEKASGKYADLQIVDIPDDVAWTIGEYDGMERVEEEHRSWGV